MHHELKYEDWRCGFAIYLLIPQCLQTVQVFFAVIALQKAVSSFLSL